MGFSFTKMHGLGNDFVVINAIGQPFNLKSADIRSLSNRRTGIGFDQMLVVETPRQIDTDFYYRIFNADGTEVGQCGNGARCVGLFIEQQQLSRQMEWRLQTKTALMRVQSLGQNQYRVYLPLPQFLPVNIPLNEIESEGVSRLQLDGEHIAYFAVNVGNPHIVIEVESVEDDEVCRLGSQLSVHPLFSQGVNVGFMQRLRQDQIKLRVYERGVGLTLACGSGACAAVVAGVTRHRLANEVWVEQPGGQMKVVYLPDKKEFFMQGSACAVYQGKC